MSARRPRPLLSLGLVALLLGTGLGCALFLEASPTVFFTGCFEGRARFEAPPDADLTLVLRTSEGSVEGCLQIVRDEKELVTLVGGVDTDDPQRAELEGGANPPIRVRIGRRPEGSVKAEALQAQASGRFDNGRLARCSAELDFEDLCPAVLFPLVTGDG